MIGIEEYKEMNSATLPYTTKWGFTLEELIVSCPQCNNNLTDTKFRFSEFPNTLSISCAGACLNCKHIVNGKPLRIYKDGRISWMNDNGQWVERKNPTILERIWIRIKKLLGF